MRESEITWYGLSYQSRSDFVKVITRSELVLSDNIFAVGGLMTEHKNAFFVESEANRLLPYNNMFKNAVTFELSQNKRVFVRNVYTVLDIMGDLGGLFGALTPLFAMIVAIF